MAFWSYPLKTKATFQLTQGPNRSAQVKKQEVKYFSVQGSEAMSNIQTLREGWVFKTMYWLTQGRTLPLPITGKATFYIIYLHDILINLSSWIHCWWLFMHVSFSCPYFADRRLSSHPIDPNLMFLQKCTRSVCFCDHRPVKISSKGIIKENKEQMMKTKTF